MPSERWCRRALAHVIEPADPAAAALVARVGPEEVWSVVHTSSGDDVWSRRARAYDADAAAASESAARARFVIPGDADWPEQLGDLTRAEQVQRMGGVPLGLWVRGAADLAAGAGSVAVVGSRAATRYGERVASDLAAELAVSGVTVISGGAYGVDAAAHRGALAEGGVTVAVLASGVDEPYPRLNAPLLEQIAASGAVVSEYPPGEHPTRRRFLARNRLIAALGGATVIVEAALRSGARNTVTWATACGRPVLAVPGPVTSAMSATPHRLIREGEAILVTSSAEIREVIQPLGEVGEDRPHQGRLLDTLEPELRQVYEALPARGGRDAGEISLRAGLSVGTALAGLDALAAEGWAVLRADGRWALGERRDRPLLPGLDGDPRRDAPGATARIVDHEGAADCSVGPASEA